MPHEAIPATDRSDKLPDPGRTPLCDRGYHLAYWTCWAALFPSPKPTPPGHCCIPKACCWHSVETVGLKAFCSND